MRLFMSRLKVIIKKSPTLCLLYHSYFGSQPEMKALKKLHDIKGGDAIDVGAHNGDFTIYFLRKCKCRHVYAFEPQADLCDYMRKYLRKFTGLQILNMGLSDSKSHLELRIPINISGAAHPALATLNAYNGDHKKISVPVDTLDSFEYKNIGIIKIDVEGHEEKVLAGAIETIKNNKPIMLIEISRHFVVKNSISWEADIPVDNIIKKIKEMGYKCYCNINDKLVDVDDIGVQEIQKDELLGTSKYICNFIFVPAEVNLQKMKRI